MENDCGVCKDLRLFLDDISWDIVAGFYARRQKGEAVPPRYELCIIRKDGEIRILEMSSATTVLSSGEIRTIGQLLDVTERKRAEESFRQAHLVVESSPAVLFRWGMGVGLAGAQIQLRCLRANEAIHYQLAEFWG